MADEREDCYFDRFQRFRAAAELVCGFAKGGRRLSVLDVGSLDNAFGGFLPGHAVVPCEARIAPGSPAPFADASFDVCVALDVIEHVAPGERAFFIGELARVAGQGLVLAFPVAQAAEAEAFVLELTRSAWLAEHQRFGLPEPADIEAILDGLSLAWTRHPNACLPSWTAMMLLMHGTDKPTRLAISGFFNRRFCEIENREPAYRYIYRCAKPGA